MAALLPNPAVHANRRVPLAAKRSYCPLLTFTTTIASPLHDRATIPQDRCHGILNVCRHTRAWKHRPSFSWSRHQLGVNGDLHALSFYIRESCPRTDRIGCWVDPIAGLDHIERRKLEVLHLGPTARSQSEYNLIKYLRFEVFTAVTMKNGVFWGVTPCGSCKNRRFGGT
jgi:hypothetical protein